MANTFVAVFPNVAFAATKNMGALLNGHATEKIKIRRVGLLNSQTAAVTGVLCSIELRRYTSGTLGTPTAVTPFKNNSTLANATTLTCGHAGTIGGTPETCRKIFWSSDEAAISTATSDEFETYVGMNTIWDSGYGDSEVDPIVLNQNEMFMIYNVSGAAGLLDSWIEYTLE